MPKYQKISIWIFTLSLFVVSVSCRLFSTGSELPRKTIPVTTEAVESLKLAVAEAIEKSKSSGIVSLFLDEEEITSLLAFELQQQADIPFTNPQVHLQDGHLVLSGSITEHNIETSVEIISSVNVKEGHPYFQITSAQLGSIQLPQSVVENLVSQVQLILERSIYEQIGNISFESIDIVDGTMKIIGHKK